MIVFGRRLHKLEKLVSDPYLLYLANKIMFKLKFQAITDPAIVLSMFMLLFCFVIVCGLKGMYACFYIVCLYLYGRLKANHQRRVVGINYPF